MKEVLELYRTILAKTDTEGFAENRTSVQTVHIFGHLMRFSAVEGYPLVTTRKMFLRGVFEELKWILSGDTNVKTLQAAGVTFWDRWANRKGQLGPVYGEMWRKWKTQKPGVTIDQIQELIVGLKTNAKSRRHIVSSWNPELLPDESKSFSVNIKNGKQALPPCHCFFQMDARKLGSRDLVKFQKIQSKRYEALLLELTLLENAVLSAFRKNELQLIEELHVRKAKVTQRLDELSIVKEDGEREFTPPTIEQMPEYGLSLLLYMRSNDTPLGLPTNIAGYAALLQLVAQECGMMVEDYIHVTGNTHIYQNQVEQIQEQVQRQPKDRPILDIEFGYEHDPENLDPAKFFYNQLDKITFDVFGYEYHPAIKFEQAAL